MKNEASLALYDWAPLNERYVRLVKPRHYAVAIKFVHTQAEYDAIPDVHPFTSPSYICPAIGLASYLNYPVAIMPGMVKTNYCAAANGLGPKDADWMAGKAMATDPTRWFRTLEASAAHTREMLKTSPNDLRAIVAAPIHLNAIKDPDVICCQLVPAAVFMVLSGIIENEYQRFDFPFIGESSCCDTWNYTCKTGKPGISLGCRGDKTQGVLPDTEMRLSLTPADFAKSLDGMERLRDSEINYPCCTGKLPPELA